jgi:hypothetical protein
VRWDLESFVMKNEMTRDMLVFIDLNLSTVVRRREPLLIVLELISNDSRLKLLLMKVLSEVVQD